MQQGNNEARRVLAAEVLRGKDRDQNRNADCWNPVFEATGHHVGTERSSLRELLFWLLAQFPNLAQISQVKRDRHLPVSHRNATLIETYGR